MNGIAMFNAKVLEFLNFLILPVLGGLFGHYLDKRKKRRNSIASRAEEVN